jgi:hypothetical protein
VIVLPARNGSEEVLLVLFRPHSLGGTTERFLRSRVGLEASRRHAPSLPGNFHRQESAAIRSNQNLRPLSLSVPYERENTMSDTNRSFDEVDYHDHLCDNCDERYKCCCPDPGEDTHTPLCSACFEMEGE